MSAMSCPLSIILPFFPDEYECHGSVRRCVHILFSRAIARFECDSLISIVVLSLESVDNGVENDVFDARTVTLHATAVDFLQRSSRRFDGRLESPHRPIPQE